MKSENNYRTWKIKLWLKIHIVDILETENQKPFNWNSQCFTIRIGNEIIYEHWKSQRTSFGTINVNTRKLRIVWFLKNEIQRPTTGKSQFIAIEFCNVQILTIGISNDEKDGNDGWNDWCEWTQKYFNRNLTCTFKL